MSVKLDQARIHHLTITQDEAKPGIEFSRESYNYLVAPKNGVIAFSPGSASGAGATTGAGARLAVLYNAVIPGQNDNLINLGSIAYHWNVIHGKKLALNASSEPTENLYVNGTARFAIGDSDTVSAKRVIIGSSGKRYLSFGGAGLQAYNTSDAGSVLYLQYQGGSVTIGQSASITSPVTIHGNLLAGAKDTYNIGSEEKPWNKLYIKNVQVNSANGADPAFKEIRTGGSSVSFGVGSGNVNHGIYSNTLGKWIAYADSSKVYLNGNANTATALATGRTLKVSLGSTNASTAFDGTANVHDIGVSGTLAPGNGGTGQTTLKAAANSLINALDTGTSTPTDNDYYVSQYVGGGTTTTTYHRRPMSALWNYIAGKGDGRYVNVSGDTMTGALNLSWATTATMDHTSTNPRIVFSESGTQPVGLIYTDYDSYRGPAGLKVQDMSGSNGKVWFEVQGAIYSGGNIYSIHPTGGETNINVAHGPDEYLMLWGNNSSGTRGLWDSTKGSIISVTDTSATFNGNASTATSLKTGRTLKVALGSTSASTAFNGTANVHDIGVSGTLGAANGGTGNTSYTSGRVIYSSSATKLSSSNIALSGYNLTSVASDATYITYKVGNSNGTLSLYAATNRGLYDNTLGGWLVYVRSSDSTLRSARPFYVDGTISAANQITISRSTSIANNYAAKLQFSVTQTDNSITSAGYIACYDDLDANSYGVNMVVNATSGLYLTAGEGAGSYLATYPSTGEDVHICADSAIYFHTNCNTTTNATTSCYITTAGYIYGARVYGAVWNDYAEYRNQIEFIAPGRVAYCKNDGKLRITTERLQKFEGVVSDTFGFSIGETENAKTPLAVSGRVLVYTYEPREKFNSGDCVCAAPNGTVSKMTREEIVAYPDRIVGIVSEIPEYETWSTGNVAVNGRIWIKVK